MFQLKNQFKTIYLCLIIVIGLLFIFNNHQVMAMKNPKAKKFVDQSLYELNTNLKCIDSEDEESSNCLHNNNLQIIYNINTSQNTSFKNSYYIKDKNLSLEDMSNNINVLNSIKKPLKKDKEKWTKLKKSNSI